MNELTRTMQDLPLTWLVPVGLAVIIGLLLWGAGRRILRPGFAAAGLLVGGGLGWILGTNLNLGVPAWVAAAIAAIALACVAVLTYRMAVAATLALVLAVGSPLAVVAVAELTSAYERDDPVETERPDPSDGPGLEPPTLADPQIPADPEEPPEPDELDRWLDERFGDQLPGSPQGLPYPMLPHEADSLGLMELDPQIEHIRDFTERLFVAASQAWAQLPDQLRPIIIAAAIVGALLGLLIGALAPGISASVVTAFGGGLLWLAGARVIAERFAEGTLMPTTGRAWLSLWIIISLIGLCIQWIFRPRPADKTQR